MAHLKRHLQSETHKLKSAKPDVQSVFSTLVEDENISMKRHVRAAEIKLSMYVAEKNMAISVMDDLPSLIASICIDSKIAKNIKCGRTKSTAILTQIVAPENINNISQHIQNENLCYSIIVDESTDISAKKSLAIVIRYFCGTRVRDRFLDMIEVEDQTDNGLYQALMECLKRSNIPADRMIGFAADNASVMMGDKGGLKAKLIANQPNLFVMGCVCHSFALCSEAACAQIPEQVETFAKDICNYFARSASRRAGFEKFQTLLELEPHRLLKLSQTRWLSLEVRFIYIFK